MPQSKVPDIDMSKWGSRLAADLPNIAPVRPVESTALKPVAVSISNFDIQRLYVAQKGRCDPRLFMQFVLERLKAAGAPVEGTIHLRLAHGAVARVKPDPQEPQVEFKYLWLPAPYAVAIATGGMGAA